MRILVFFTVCMYISGASQQTASLEPVRQLPQETVDVQFVSAAVGWCRTTQGLYRTIDN
jgi:hypothetical protein